MLGQLGLQGLKGDSTGQSIGSGQVRPQHRQVAFHLVLLLLLLLLLGQTSRQGCGVVKQGPIWGYNIDF